MARAATIALFFMLSPFLIGFFQVTGLIYISLTLWLCAWIWFLRSKEDAFTRGIMFLGVSVFIATTSRFLLKGHESEAVLELASQMMLFVGGGIGANFMSHTLLKGPLKPNSSKVK